MLNRLIARFRAIRSYRHKQVKDCPFPPVLHFEMTNACNLCCTICPRAKMTRPVGFAPLDLVRRVAAEVSGRCELVTLHAWGESILHPEFDQIIRIFHNHGLTTYLSTNAVALNEDRQDRLLSSGLDLLTFSLDATSPDTYERLRAGGDYEKAVTNVQSFLQKRCSSGIRLACVCQLIRTGQNLQEVATFKQEWSHLGAYVRIKPFNTWNGRDLTINQHAPDRHNRAPRRVCDWPWRQVVVHWDGNIVPCCNDCNDEVVLGTVGPDSIEKVWNDGPMKRFRKAHLSGRSEVPFCRVCQYTPLGIAGQAAFVALDYLSSLKVQMRFEELAHA